MRGSHKQFRLVGQGGWLAIEALVALTLVMVAIPVVQSYYASYQLENTSMAAAKQLQRIEDAVDGYVKSNWGDFELGASDPNRKVFSVAHADLEADGLLPNNFNMTNPFGQTYAVYVVAEKSASASDPDKLVSVVIGEGGRPGPGTLDGSDLKLATEVLPSAAEKVGLSGGVVPYSEMPGATPGVIEGTNGSWTYDPPFSPVDQGSLAAVNFYVSGAVNNEYLYRNDVGIPELNQMNVSLDMNGNSVENVDRLDANTVAAGSVETTTIDSDGKLTFSSSVPASDTGAEFNSNVKFDKDINVAQNGNFGADVDIGGGVTVSENVTAYDVELKGLGNKRLSTMVSDMAITDPNDQLSKPTCPTGTSPQIFSSVVAAPTGTNMSVQTLSGPKYGDIIGYQASVDPNTWRVRLKVNIRNNATNSSRWYRLANPTSSDDYGKVLSVIKCT